MRWFHRVRISCICMAMGNMLLPLRVSLADIFSYYGHLKWDVPYTRNCHSLNRFRHNKSVYLSISPESPGGNQIKLVFKATQIVLVSLENHFYRTGLFYVTMCSSNIYVRFY